MNVFAFRMLAAVTALTFLTSCAMGPETAQMDYKEVKTMVIDILKTEDGQKAIDDARKKTERESAGQLKILQTGQGKQLQMAVKDIMKDPAYAHSLKELMVDPKFAGDFAKAINKEVKDIHKDLLKDPEYQKALMDVMKDPEYEKMLLETMKSRAYRQQMMTVMKESLDSPLFQADVIKLMGKALEEQSKPKKKKGGGES